MGKKGRKNGCPVNIRNWVVSILDVATQQFVRIYGLTSRGRQRGHRYLGGAVHH